MIFLRGMVIWLVFILAESLNGAVRNAWLVPAFGDRLAYRISFAIGSLLIVAIATLFIRWLNASNVSQLIGIGVLWLLLTLGFEVSLGCFIFGYSWERIVADYNLAQGGFMAIGLVLVAVAPLIATKLQSVQSSGLSKTFSSRTFSSRTF